MGSMAFFRPLLPADALPLLAACALAVLMERRNLLTPGTLFLSFAAGALAGGVIALGLWGDAFPSFFRWLYGSGASGISGWPRFWGGYALYGGAAWPFIYGFRRLRQGTAPGGDRWASLIVAAFTGCLMVPYVSAAGTLTLLAVSFLYGVAGWLHSAGADACGWWA